MAGNIRSHLRAGWGVSQGLGAGISLVASVLQIVQVVVHEILSTILITATVIGLILVLAPYVVRTAAPTKADETVVTEGAGGVPVTRTTSVEGRPRFERVCMAIGALSLVVMAITVGGRAVGLFPAVRGEAGPESSGSVPIISSPAPASVVAGVVCPRPQTYPAEVVDVRSNDGQPGIGSDLTANVTVKDAPASGHLYWLFAKVSNGDSNFVYVAKREIPPSPGSYPLRVLLPKSPVDSKRDLFVVDGDASSQARLRENYAHDGDAGWDNNRLSLPVGVVPISNVCTVTKDHQ
jgi:hypothetical protein